MDFLIPNGFFLYYKKNKIFYVSRMQIAFFAKNLESARCFISHWNSYEKKCVVFPSGIVGLK